MVLTHPNLLVKHHTDYLPRIAYITLIYGCVLSHIEDAKRGDGRGDKLRNLLVYAPSPTLIHCSFARACYSLRSRRMAHPRRPNERTTLLLAYVSRFADRIPRWIATV
jgi:hypothetical protein